MKKTILVDIDNTINDLNHVWISYINVYCGTNYKYSDITYWDFFNDLQRQGIDAFKFLDMKGFWENVLVYPNAILALETWVKKGHKVRLVTDSDILSPRLKDKMHHTLKHFDSQLINKKSVIITGDKGLVEGDIVLDDKSITCLERLRKGAKGVYLIKQPWNEELQDKFSSITIDSKDLDKRWDSIYNFITKEHSL